MARKIIPLKYKKSPVKYGLWDIFTKSGIGAGKGDEFGVGRKETEFESLKEGLYGMDVSKNFYKDIVNPYAGLTDPMAGIEKKAEDLTINQRQFAQQERSMQRGLSQVLEQSKRTGTQSTQAIANQLAQSSGDISASIGEQERQNQMLALKESSELDIKKAESKRQTDLLTRKGAHETQMQMIKGEEDVLSRELNKQQALLGLVSGELARADVQTEQDKNWFQRTFSDKRLKNNIVFIKKSPSGLNIYNFEYKDSKFGKGVYQGVMSDEIPCSAVTRHSNGYDMVDYNKIDVEFLEIRG